MKRRHMSSSESKRDFRKNASRTQSLNMPRRFPMRGGIRL